MKVVMIHIRPRFLPLDISDLAFPGLLHLPDRPRSAAYQNQKQTSPDLVLGEIFFGCQVFLFAAVTIDSTHTRRACAQPRNRRLKPPAIRTTSPSPTFPPA